MRFATIALPLALAACGGGQPEASPEQNAAATAEINAVDERVSALTAGQRNGVLIRAIRDAGFACQGVTSSEKAPAPARATWIARCADGTGHLIAFGANGMANVTSVRPQ